MKLKKTTKPAQPEATVHPVKERVMLSPLGEELYEEGLRFNMANCHKRHGA